MPGTTQWWLRLIGLAWLALGAGSRDSLAAQLDPSHWKCYDYSGPLAADLRNTPGAPQPAVRQLTNLTDQKLSTFATLSNPAVLLVDFGRTNVVDRVYLIGSKKPLNRWRKASEGSSKPPLGLIVVYVGDTPATTNRVAAYTVPYDAGDPVETEADLRFNPTAGRFVRLELQTQVTWGKRYWPGYDISQPPSTKVGWNVGELELYGFAGVAATTTNVHAVVLPPNAATPLAQAAGDLSYYLGELTGLPHPIIAPASTKHYCGRLYQIVDLAPLAPDYDTMMANISSGQLPTNVNAAISGRVVTFKGWPYRTVLWSVWEFLERQGIRWVYPDAHGDYVPRSGLNLSVLPFEYTPSTFSIYANFGLDELQPWPRWELQSVRQESLYPWRNHWTSCQTGNGPLGGREIPARPAPKPAVNPDCTEGFVGYPHNFNGVVPNRILETHTNWWGWASTNPASRINPARRNAPTFAMDEPSLISWVADKMINIAAAQPLPCSEPLSICHWHRPFNLLPMDGCVYSHDPYTIAANGPALPNSVPWVNAGDVSYSGMYYTFVTSVAKRVQQRGSDALVGALAYADVFLPPTNIAALATFPTNVQVEVCLYGAPNLPMSSPANAALKAAVDGWHSTGARLATYDYALLHIDYWQKDPRLPVPLIAGTVDRAKYLAGIGALDGGCQAELESLPYNPWNFYAYPRIRWNTNQTAAQLKQEFFTGYFREAAAPMLAYYQAMEKHQVANNVNMYYMGYCYNITPASFPLCVLAAMQTNLAKAQAVATNWWVASRVADAAAGFDWVVAHSPGQLKPGQDFSDTSPYPALEPATSPTAINLAEMQKPRLGVRGNSASSQGSGADTRWLFSSRGWNSEGWIQRTYNVTAGTYRLEVTARAGDSTGYWPRMNVYLGPASGSVPVTSTTDSTYSFTFTVPAGAWDVVVTDINLARGVARDLVVDRLQITRL